MDTHTYLTDLSDAEWRVVQPLLPPAAFSQAAAQNQHWTGTDVAAWMSQRLGRPVSCGLGWSYLVKLKHRQQRPRPQHALADPKEQVTFKKTFDRC
jgi:hypothetical protein